MGAPALWVMVLAMGAYQGLNPPMGWLYAVSRGLEQDGIARARPSRSGSLPSRAIRPSGDPASSHRRSTHAVLGGTTAFAAGHYLAMLAVLLPAALALAFVPIDPMAIRPWLGAALIAFGFFKLYRPSHPRLLVRIPPNRPMRYSFAMALTHCGSPMMMLGPLASMLFLLELGGHAGPAMDSRLAWFSAAALALPAAMAAALLFTASAVAVLVYRRLGLAVLTRYWLNFDFGWAIVFLAMGAMALVMSATGAMPLLPEWAQVLGRLVCGSG